MPTDIVVPELGESVVEARVAKWRKQPGDRVEVGDVLVELETDKIDLEVGATQAGVLARVDRGDGADVRIGERLGVIDEAGTGEAVTPSATGAGKPPDEPRATPPPTVPIQAETRAPKATPTAQRIAVEHDVALGGVKGTGVGGRVTRRDVEAAVAARPAAAGAPAERPAEAAGGEREERVRMSKRRLTIGRRLVEAQRTAAMLTTFNEIDMTAIQELRRRHKEAFKAMHGVSLGLTSFFVKAACVALAEFPRLNAEIQGEEMVLKKYYDIGIAVGASGGLVVPVLRDADRLSFAAIEQRVKEFARRAEDGTLALDDLRGGTFTITNGGVFGSLLSTPILNPPQVGILGLHKIEDRVVPIAGRPDRDREGSDDPAAAEPGPARHGDLTGRVVIRPMMYVALSYDHRIVDGLEAVSFLVRLKQIVEDPASLLLRA
jgi:2-oxoglutarate dehydrogenase E2 component (dihydrolipoamide succinyltransferase)